MELASLLKRYRNSVYPSEASMQNSKIKKTIFLTLAMSIILACNSLMPAAPQPAATLNSLYTSAAQTLNAMSTQGGVFPTIQPTSTGTLTISTASPIALQTLTVLPPVQPSVKCDAAAFVTDVTYPDGSNVGVGVLFTKIWRIKNVGSCTWTTSYALVYVKGEKFGAQSFVPLPGSVAPGQSIDLPVQLSAPNQSGRFKGYWLLRNSSGGLFGVGNSGEESVYLDVNVSGYAITGYDFLEKYCEAEWTTGSQVLPCPGTDKDSKGFVVVMNALKMENGSVQNKALITHPQMVKDGFVSGKYPGITVQSGDRFQASINCMYNADDCNAIIKLQYQIGNGAIQTLGQWNEIYDGQYYAVNADLSGLTGQNVKFILAVLANGSAHEDYAMWVLPRITRFSTQPPTATATPSPTATVTSTATTTATFTATATSTATEAPTATAIP